MVEKGVSKLWGFIKDYILPLGGDVLIYQLLTKRQMNPDVLQQFRDFVRDGKREEAVNLLKAQAKGEGLYDESIIMTDMLALLRLGMITDTEFNCLTKFMNVDLTKRERTNFRVALTLQPDEEKRRENLIYLAKITDDAIGTNKKAALKAFGLSDASLVEGWFDKLAALDFSKADFHKVIDAINKVPKQLEDFGTKIETDSKKGLDWSEKKRKELRSGKLW